MACYPTLGQYNRYSANNSAGSTIGSPVLPFTESLFIILSKVPSQLFQKILVHQAVVVDLAEGEIQCHIIGRRVSFLHPSLRRCQNRRFKKPDKLLQTRRSIVNS